MKEPGELGALDATGLAAWNERIAHILDLIAEEGGENPFALPITEYRETAVTGPDWIGFPVRIARCLSRQQALELLDWNEDGGERWRALQEDYIEWRVVRNDRGIQRVELTTELSDYWRDLAAHAPSETLRLVAEFAEEADVDPRAVYGRERRHVDRMAPKQREEAFVATMLPPAGSSPYNNGERAICCMVQQFNDLRALFRLVMGATRPRVVQDPATGRVRCMTAAEAIPLVRAAQQGRSSDPVLVERLNRLASEGRQVGLDDPLGIYIQDVEHTRLRLPDGSPVPRDWFQFSRGLGPADSSDGRSRYQRLVLEVPDEEPQLCVSDLTDIGTGQKVVYGGQIAELVQLVVFIRVTEPGVVPIDPRAEMVPSETADPYGCEQVRADWQSFLATTDAGRATPGRQPPNESTS